MKKSIMLTVTLIFVLALTACVSDKELVLPKPEDITEIVVEENSLGVMISGIDDQKEISELIDKLRADSKYTDKESVNDQPTNIDKYIAVKFHHKIKEESSSILYLYQEKGESYIEQPYSGIWKLSNEVYNDVNSYFAPEDGNSNEGYLQTLYDRSLIAKEFADKQISEYLKPLNSDYEVVETACSFIANDFEHFFVSYKCNNKITDLFYGYKIAVDDKGNCKIIDEGETVGKSLFE